MRLALRVIIGVAGVLGLLVAVRLWMAPAELAGQLGVSASGSLGLATIRADMGGFFAAGGMFALAAAIKARGGLLLPSVVLIGLALVGRIVAVAMNGFAPEMGPPMAVEAVLLVLFVAGWRMLPR
ncbi:MAG TPA: hypothetical protein PLH23_02760 [Hyphomonadaceae bacterium]|nr:hypothetical protein [Hyphomonadaceae bacterium]HPI47159.1 hypothetical protein [Hyphomonadaceae bacterium]